MSDSFCNSRITLLAGGVGGAKLARGFGSILPARSLKVVTNTADDTIFYGLYVSPDLDTMMYTMAGLIDPKKGWGVRGDSFHVLSQLSDYGESSWFNLGDRDLATHILRTKMLREGMSLTQVTLSLSKRLGTQATILPMTDQRVETYIKSDKGFIPFQEYFVKMQRKVRVRGVRFKGIRKARCTDEVNKTIKDAELIVIAPSNPIVSVLPILSVHPMRRLIRQTKAMKIAVSPFIGKRAISGPAKELLESKGYEGSSYGLARFFGGLTDVLVIHHADQRERASIEKTGTSVVVTDTLMRNMSGSVRLAKDIFRIFREFRKSGS